MSSKHQICVKNAHQLLKNIEEAMDNAEKTRDPGSEQNYKEDARQSWYNLCTTLESLGEILFNDE